MAATECLGRQRRAAGVRRGRRRTSPPNTFSVRVAHLVRLCLLVVVVTACADASPDRTRTRTERIADGTLSEADPAIVLIEIGDVGLCSGVLVTPHLVLTAGHCLSGQFVPIDCGATSLQPALPVSTFRVTNWPDLQASPPRGVFHKAASARVLFVGSDICGNDLGLLELVDALKGAAPRVLAAGPPQLGTAFRMIGYGAGHSAGTGERIRRTSDALEVLCTSPGSCTPLEGGAGAPLLAPPDLAPGEWLGPAGACPGDSGGPALRPANPKEDWPERDMRDGQSGSDEVVTGVLSRGTNDCALSIFSFPNRPELRAEVRRSARQHGHTVPSWANERPSLSDEPQPASPGGGGAGEDGLSQAGAGGALHEPAPNGAADSVDSSGCTCRAGARSPATAPSTWILLTLAAAICARRRRYSSC